MFLQHKADAPTRTLAGGALTSHVLLQSGDARDEADAPTLTVTWVEIAPGGAHRPHRHAPEQVYVIVEGRGCVHVGRETREVRAGDLVRIPPQARHYAENPGPDVLRYVSAATPAFDALAAFDRWPGETR